MTSRYRLLGMDRDISRRDFLNGSAMAIGAALLPGCSGQASAVDLSDYPPAKMGMRGAHPGAFEAAHALVEGRSWETHALAEDYDVIVVGAGISGLTAAYIYTRDIDPKARILILDNHDDFGGHAKRNEFTYEGRTLIGFGGTMLMEEPAGYPEVAKTVIEELGIDYARADDYYQADFFTAQGLQTATFFDAETFGQDHLGLGGLFDPSVLINAPLSEGAKADLARLFADEVDPLADKTDEARRNILNGMSWQDYLKAYLGLGDEALRYIQKRSHGVWAIGADALPAYLAAADSYPGFGKTKRQGTGAASEGGNYFFFPDGNASIARLLVKKLIPEVAPSQSMEDLVTDHYDYSALDQPGNAARIRLSSMVTTLKHRGGDLSGPVDVTYVKGDAAFQVSAKKVVWAGYHAMLPYLCPDIPEEQRAALALSERAPLTYTNVLIRNWRSFKKLGFSRAYCPGSVFNSVRMTFPVSMGDYKHSSTPDDPVILHLQHIPTDPGKSAAEQFRQGRRQLLETPFETFELNVRTQLNRILGPGGFDAANDIAAITVNRWPHGYAYSVDPETEDVAFLPDEWEGRYRPWVEARRPIGNIVMAGTDAASNAMSEAAIEEAYRAVHSFAKKTG